jgi:hypothetical protein
MSTRLLRYEDKVYNYGTRRLQHDLESSALRLCVYGYVSPIRRWASFTTTTSLRWALAVVHIPLRQQVGSHGLSCCAGCIVY